MKRHFVGMGELNGNYSIDLASSSADQKSLNAILKIRGEEYHICFEVTGNKSSSRTVFLSEAIDWYNNGIPERGGWKNEF